MKYDPNNELSESEQSSLSEDEFFEYLDSKEKLSKTIHQAIRRVPYQKICNPCEKVHRINS